MCAGLHSGFNIHFKASHWLNTVSCSFRTAWISCTVRPRGVTAVSWSISWKIWKMCSLITSTRWESLVLPQCPWSWSVKSFNCTLSSLLKARAQTKFRDRMFFLQCTVRTRASYTRASYTRASYTRVSYTRASYGAFKLQTILKECLIQICKISFVGVEGGGQFERICLRLCLIIFWSHDISIITFQFFWGFSSTYCICWCFKKNIFATFCHKVFWGSVLCIDSK